MKILYKFTRPDYGITAAIVDDADAFRIAIRRSSPAGRKPRIMREGIRSSMYGMTPKQYTLWMQDVARKISKSGAFE